MIKEIIQTLKINHYIKNAVVIIPLIFSLNYTNKNSLLLCALIFIAFCLVSSSVYVLNDLVDIKKDREHPVKKHRPITCGKISRMAAVLLLSILLVTSCIIALNINILCFSIVIFYFLLNVLYSVWLKNIVLIDVACISFGFILRILAGCFAINVIPSPLVVLMMFFGSMFFTFIKRKLELQLLGTTDQCRKSIKGFDIATVNQFISLNAVMLISFYLTYMLDKTTIERAGTPYLYVTVIPFTLIIYRLLLLANSSQSNDDPMHLIGKDCMIKILTIFYIALLLLVLTI